MERSEGFPEVKTLGSLASYLCWEAGLGQGGAVRGGGGDNLRPQADPGLTSLPSSLRNPELYAEGSGWCDLGGGRPGSGDSELRVKEPDI